MYSKTLFLEPPITTVQALAIASISPEVVIKENQMLMTRQIATK